MEGQCTQGFIGIQCEISLFSTSTPFTTSPLIVTTSQKTSNIITTPTTVSTSTLSTATSAPMPCPANVQNICQNGATCLLSSNGYFCKCINGFTGIFCNIVSTTTYPTTLSTLPPNGFQSCPPNMARICQNNSTCIFSNQSNVSLCKCQLPYFGLF
jgi:hypothetical protein